MVEKELPNKAFGWAATDQTGVLSPFHFSRRATGEKDVCLKVMYCGICHSDLHMIKNDMGFTTYPFVPGHEIVGIVKEVGSKVEKFKVGDRVGVGCMIGSCLSCEECNNNLENYCPQVIPTFLGKYYDGTVNYGGYSDIMVADQHFVVNIPLNLPLHAAAPLLCAGISVYSPLKYYGLHTPGMHVGVVGLGGLGHMVVKFGKAMGLKVTVISTSPHKEYDAIQSLGADSFLVSSDNDQMKEAMSTMDGIIDTVSGNHPLLPLLDLLKPHGKLVLIGVTAKSHELPPSALLSKRKMVGGSSIGGMKETQEMINFAAEHGITADVELIPFDYINTAIDRLLKADVKYRFVIDIANSVSSNDYIYNI
ncbi:probable mannitol dehydrogenase [Euphorbia lathyris]|uniref:probable mannitol dehydrogenase n=1 Tax=Euphorbia lathyris TaxID=212925 RepID=UPI003313EBA3